MLLPDLVDKCLMITPQMEASIQECVIGNAPVKHEFCIRGILKGGERRLASVIDDRESMLSRSNPPRHDSPFLTRLDDCVNDVTRFIFDQLFDLAERTGDIVEVSFKELTS